MYTAFALLILFVDIVLFYINNHLIKLLNGIAMNKLIKLQEVEQVTGLKKSTIYQRIKEGRFLVAVRLGSRSVAWKSEEIQEWTESRPRVKS